MLRERLETVLLALLICYAIWLPLPFGAVTVGSRPYLLIPPLILCAAAAASRYAHSRAGGSRASWSFAFRVWTVGAVLFIALTVFQLIPLPPAVIAALSPATSDVWSEASGVVRLATGSGSMGWRPLSVEPSATRFELLRLLALLAAFQAAAMLGSSTKRRLAVAVAIAAAATFVMLYGVREAALDRFAIWGWRNTKIFGRVTGTFVNPNHFAHYVALAFPLALFGFAIAWHEAARPRLSLGAHLARVLDRRPVLSGVSVLLSITCLAAILVAQSRGALLAVTSAVLIVAALMLRRSRRSRRWAALLAVGAAVVFITLLLVAYLGAERTIARFKPLQEEQATFGGRRTGIVAAFRLWERFPLLGTGVGTFEDVVSMTQAADVSNLYSHAHNDYLEIAATAGTAGLVIALVTLLAGYVALARETFGARGSALRWNRRAYQGAAFASLTIAMIHALVDFNFFIPANAATLAIIVGTAVAPRYTRESSGDAVQGSASADSQA